MDSEAWLTIDGSQGEGGGQILRTSLALSLCLGRPFRIVHLRAHRPKPGLARQHLASVRAAAAIGEARVQGAELKSPALTFEPRGLVPGEYRFDIGSAGSTTLVLQTVLPALLTAEGPSRLLLDGGTHNPFAPPFDFLDAVFLPLLRTMGPRVEARCLRPGFYPGGGGRMEVRVDPAPRLHPLRLVDRGAVRTLAARVTIANLPESIAERERRVLARELDLPPERCSVRRVSARGPGNVVSVQVTSEHVTEQFTAFGARGVPAESVARQAAGQARAYLHAGVPVGPHLADQLLLPLVLAGSGEFVTGVPTPHTATNRAVIEQFTGTPLSCEEWKKDVWRIGISANRAAS